MKKKAGFKPSDYAGCQLWLDGADPNGTGRAPANGAVLTSWTDKSGTGNTVTLPSLTYSVNTFTGYPGVVFTSGTASSQLTLTPYDCFFASSYTSALFPTSYPGLLGQTTVLMFGNYYQSANFMANGGGFNTNGLNTYGNYVADARNMTVSDVYSLPSSSFSLRVGTGDLYPYNSWLGHIYEVIVFSNSLNTSQRQQIEGYLCQKWGTASYLPASNPGRTGVIYPRSLQIDSLITGQPTLKPYIRPLRPVALGGSFQFTTTPTQYLSIPNNAGFTQNTAFTYEFWYYPTSTNSGYLVAMLQPNWLTLQWSRHGAGTIGIDMSYVGDPPGYVRQNRTYAINRWHHIALSWNGTNGVLYMNGVSEAVFTGAGGLVNAGNDLRIGQYQEQSQQTPLGYFTNIRFVKGVSVYTGAFTPPTAPLTVTQSAGTNISAITVGQTQLLILATNSAGLLTDSSTNNFTITNNGSVSWNALTPFS